MTVNIATPCVYTQEESEGSYPPVEAGPPAALDPWVLLRASDVGEETRFVAMDTEFLLVESEDSEPASRQFRVLQPGWEGVRADWPVASSEMADGAVAVDICRVGPVDESSILIPEPSAAGVRVLACSDEDCVILGREPGDERFALIPAPGLPALGVHGGLACSEDELCVYGQGGLWCLVADTWEHTISLPGSAIQEAALGWGFVPGVALSTNGELWITRSGYIARENAAGESGVRVLRWSSAGLAIASATGEVFLNHDFEADLNWDSICVGGSQAVAVSTRFNPSSETGPYDVVDSTGTVYSMQDSNPVGWCAFEDRLSGPIIDTTALFGPTTFVVTQSEVLGLWD